MGYVSIRAYRLLSAFYSNFLDVFEHWNIKSLKTSKSQQLVSLFKIVVLNVAQFFHGREIDFESLFSSREERG